MSLLGNHFGQIAARHIPSAEADQHLLNRSSPDYPALAQRAWIQGNVILEILVSPTGTASIHRYITGHPMLAPAAIRMVPLLKYRPFEIDGKPTPVITAKVVRFGHPSKDNEERDTKEVAFLDAFWPALETGELALDRGDLSGAELPLKDAGNALKQMKAQNGTVNNLEEMHWLISMGVLAQRTAKYDDAEQYYDRALRVPQGNSKDSPEIASALGHLGSLYAEENKYELARDRLLQSIAAYQKNFDRAPADVKELYGRAITTEASAVFTIAVSQEKYTDATQACETLSRFSTFLTPADQQARLSACEKLKDTAKSK